MPGWMTSTRLRGVSLFCDFEGSPAEHTTAAKGQVEATDSMGDREAIPCCRQTQGVPLRAAAVQAIACPLDWLASTTGTVRQSRRNRSMAAAVR